MNVAVETGRRVQGVTGVSRDTPYLPDYNLIKPFFYLLKQWQHRHAYILLIYGEDQYTEKFEAFLFALVREFGHRVN